VDVIAALAVALGAFDAEHVELALDMASPQICRANATRIPAPKKQPKSAIHLKVSQESAELDESDRELLAVIKTTSTATPISSALAMPSSGNLTARKLGPQTG
jgi:hypothetical protein